MTPRNVMTSMLHVILLLWRFCDVDGHGYLYDPPSRSSLWRHGFDVTPNYNDNALFCGGKEVQWGRNGGKCGICGDRYDGPRHNEAGGVYATGIISRKYTQGSVLPITVVLTAPHDGWFEFRLCPNNDVTKAATQECLDMYVLGLANSPENKRYYGISRQAWRYDLEYQLPPSLTCGQCVLQWKYNTGKDWGCQEGTNICAVGLGQQEQFYGCADIAILPRGGFTQKTTTTKTTSSTTRRSTEARKTTTATTTTPTTAMLKSTTTTGKQPTTRQQTETSRMTSKPTDRTTPAPMTLSMTGKTTPSSRFTSQSTAATTTTTKATPRPPCRGAGIFRGTVMDNRCLYMCMRGTCPELTCTDACRELLNYNAENEIS